MNYLGKLKVVLNILNIDFFGWVVFFNFRFNYCLFDFEFFKIFFDNN